MTFTDKKKPPTNPAVYAMLWVSPRSVAQISEFLVSEGIPEAAIDRRMHLTVYYASRLLPGLSRDKQTRRVQIEADVLETRFMPLVPGGENPRPDIDPASKSVGIRLTRRNQAIDDIQALRREMCELETPEMVGKRQRSTAWKSCFGAKKYQPHILFLRRGSGIDRDLRPIGTAFRSHIQKIEFNKYKVITKTPPGNRLRTPLGEAFPEPK